MSKVKLLVIPHEFGTGMRIRAIEYARHLCNRFDVYCLAWPDMIQASDGGRDLSALRRLGRGISSLVPWIRLEQVSSRFHYVWGPFFQPALVRRALGRAAAFELARRINRVFLERVVSTISPDLILLSNGLIYPVRDSSAPVFFDWYDWFDERGHGRADWAREARYIKRIREGVRGHVVVSRPLRGKLKAEYGVDASYFPNGVDVARCRSVPEERVRVLRRKLGIESRYVIGCMGNYGAGSGLDLLQEAFGEVERAMPDASLLIVGPVPGGPPPRRDRSNVNWVSRVAPDDVPTYIRAMDLTVIPKRKNSMSDMAFHLKGVEYTACRKVIVSHRLASVVDLGWPHVVFTDETVAGWVGAIRAARKIRWRAGWDSIVEDYDWHRLADRLARWMNRTAR